MSIDDALLILRQVDSKADWSSLENQEQIAEAIKLAFDHYLSRYFGVGMAGVEGAPDWQSYELKIWETGESLRHFLKSKRRWKGKGPLLDVVAEVLSDRKYGKGRQTFALLLGDFGAGDYGEALAQVLDDPEVYGHAVKALTKAKIRGYADEVKRIEQRETGWIRNAARRYLQFAGADSVGPS